MKMNAGCDKEEENVKKKQSEGEVYVEDNFVGCYGD